jgi:hypothetical protein
MSMDSPNLPPEFLNVFEVTSRKRGGCIGDFACRSDLSNEYGPQMGLLGWVINESGGIFVSDVISPSIFEREYQEFVKDGGLDREQSQVPNEEYERTRMSILCTHRKMMKDCVFCYKPPKPYYPGDPK